MNTLTIVVLAATCAAGIVVGLLVRLAGTVETYTTSTADRSKPGSDGYLCRSPIERSSA